MIQERLSSIRWIKTLTLVALLHIQNPTLLGSIPSGYYDDASGKSGSDLKSALHDIVSDHTKYPYTSGSTDVWDILKASDEDPDDSNNVILLYTGRSQLKTENSGESSTSGSNRWNREHVWSKSHGFRNESDSAYTDCHHLRPADESVNSSRSTRDFDEASTQHAEATECYYDNDEWTWEPRDDVKGDVARMMFYMVVRYDPGYHSDNSTYDLELVDSLGTQVDQPLFGKLSTLLAWHAADPVDSFEQNRNEVVYSYQGNRNPFIDHPEYADSLWNDALPAPTNLQSSNIEESSLDLSWADNATDESGYYLYQDDTKISTLSANATTSSVTGLTSGTTYTFKVSAYRTEEESTKASVDVTTSGSGNLIITGVFDGPLSGGTPKGIEIYVIRDVADLSSYGVGSAANGGASNGEDFEFPAESATAGNYIYLSYEETQFTNWFGSAPDFTDGCMSINGDDVIELFYNNTVIDVFGVLGEDGSGMAWEYLDGWAYSDDNRSVSTTFNSGDWSYSGPNALDGETTNASATDKFPIGTFSTNDQSLPVELSEWRAHSTGGVVELLWTTESEIENQGFLIDRGLEGQTASDRTWEQISSFASNPDLAGQGSTMSQNRYSYIDTKVNVGETYSYRLADVDYQGKLTHHQEISVSVKAAEYNVKPGGFALHQVFPNPFNSDVNLSFTLEEPTDDLSLSIFNVQGVLVQTLTSGHRSAGTHNYDWDGVDTQGNYLPSGLYLVRLASKSNVQIQRVTLLK